jgi:hypothetical protein
VRKGERGVCLIDRPELVGHGLIRGIGHPNALLGAEAR